GAPDQQAADDGGEERPGDQQQADGHARRRQGDLQPSTAPGAVHRQAPPNGCGILAPRLLLSASSGPILRRLMGCGQAAPGPAGGGPMQFGLFGAAQAQRGGAPDVDSAAGFKDYIDYVIEAEGLGYQSVFVVEHHFTGFGQVSATLNFLTW